MAARHQSEREKAGLSHNDLAHINFPSTIRASDIQSIEKRGAVPKQSFSLIEYLIHIGIKTDMDVLYILFGEHLPIRSSASDKQLWAMLSQLPKETKEKLHKDIQQKFEEEKQRNLEIRSLLETGEIYRGITISDKFIKEDSNQIKKMRSFVDDVIDRGCEAFIAWVYHSDIGYQIEVISGFEKDSEQDESIRIAANLNFDYYTYLDEFCESQCKKLSDKINNLDPNIYKFFS